ncbi:MAG: response regulator [Chloroflexota bacterium]
MTKPQILIIEDDAHQLNIFELTLRSGGFETDTATDGDMARQRLLETTPDLVVLDLHLPKVAGTDLLAQIRTDARLKHTRVILATASALLAENLRAQADIVLLKPISPTQLKSLALRLCPLEDTI